METLNPSAQGLRWSGSAATIRCGAPIPRYEEALGVPLFRSVS
jgi:hypothetical protein